MRGKIFCALLHLCGIALYCQEREVKKINPDQVIEYILGRGDIDNGLNEVLIEELTSVWNSLSVSPLNINRARRSDLEQLRIFNEFEINSLLDYRIREGNILSFLEFSLIPGIDPDKLAMIKPFISFREEDMTVVSFKPVRFQVLFRSSLIHQKREGYTPVSKAEYLKNPNIRYLGSPLLIYCNSSIKLGDKASLFISAEKDPGETGIDNIIWSASLDKIKAAKNIEVEKVIIGCYYARFGQGLVLWNGFHIDSFWEPSESNRREQKISVYRSSDENSALNGVAMLVNSGNYSTSIMLSLRGYDARLANGGYTSVLNTGLHNTPLTLERKKMLSNAMAAFNFGYSGKRTKLGLTISCDKNSHLYTGRDSLLLAKASVYGKTYANFGADISVVSGKVLFFSEAAVDISGSPGMTTGIFYRFSDKTELSVKANYITPGYLARHSVIDCDGAEDKSVSIWLKHILSKELKIRVRAGLNKEVAEYSLRAEYRPAPKIMSEIRASKSGKKAFIRADLKLGAGDYTEFHTRVDFSVSHNQADFAKGFHFHQEVIFKVPSNNFAFSARLAWFDVEEWNNRIYSYEREMLYQFRTTALYGKGVRWYFNFKAQISKYAELWFRYSSFTYSDRDTTGEGLEMIQGPSKGEAKIQLRIRL